ncbi:LPS export ABC transporter periplasmic protein LptC [Candidatus Pelagibacter sp. HIMB1715]|uniref:LPS export ABC transporter periplasmic protein LptC n=1 Tax=Candidatus Pelagibacter sp. HIMB1715 TaxID=3413369 RepID=UPI003F826C50
MKYLNFRSLTISIVILISIVLIYYNNFQKKKTNQILNLESKENNSTNSNIIKDIKYSSKDLKGNEYIIIANEGEIDLDNTDIIFLKDVKAFIKLTKKNETIRIISDFGKYNTINFDTIFSRNVNVEYLDNLIVGDYLDFSKDKNLLIITKNVVYTNSSNVLKADVIELDTITKNTKIFMHNTKAKVKIESQN